MKRTGVFALSFVLCASVSGLALAQTPPKGYKPSVPARMTEKQAAAAAKKSETDMTKELNRIPAQPSASTPAMEKMMPPAAPGMMAPAPKMGADSKQTAPNSMLSKALAKAYEFNPELKSFRSRLKAIDEQVPQARAGWLPTVTADYSRGEDRETIGTRDEVKLKPETKALTVTQPIFNGGETLARTDRALAAVEVGRSDLRDAEQQVLLNAVKAYAEVVRSKEVLELSINNEQVLGEQLQATQERFDLGETTRTDVAQSEARLARATSDKIRAEGELKVARANYLRIIGEEAGMVSMPAKLPAIPKNLEEALAIGLERNPTLKSTEFNQQIADSDVDASFATLLPDVNLQGRLTRREESSSTLPQDIDNDSVLLNVSIPLFQSGAEYSRIRANKRTREQRREQYEDTRNRTVEQVTSTWRDIETARASIKANKSTVESAQIALEGVRQEAEVGSRTTLDVLDAEQELFLSRVNLVAAQAREVTAVYSHLAAIGHMNADSLGLAVPTYNPEEHYKDVRFQFIGW